MNQLLISVRDLKAEFFSPPMLVRTKGEAVRTFSDAVNSKDHQFAWHPEDFCLCLLGTMDISTGLVVAELSPVVIVSGFDVMRETPQALKAVP